jgi:hypothetical protein
MLKNAEHCFWLLILPTYEWVDTKPEIHSRNTHCASVRQPTLFPTGPLTISTSIRMFRTTDCSLPKFQASSTIIVCWLGTGTLQLTVLPLLGSIDDSEDEVDNDGQQKNDGQHRRTEAVVEAGLTSHPNGLCSPVVRH